MEIRNRHRRRAKLSRLSPPRDAQALKELAFNESADQPFSKNRPCRCAHCLVHRSTKQILILYLLITQPDDLSGNTFF